ncbi:MAG TPA: hemolysin family protein [Bacteroidia bacterium]|jgi:putative hemolysin|nr:hemolysin family protein [Bacteroidia bacterium]
MFTFSVIFISLLFSFFFSGLEIAYVSSNKLQIRIESQKESLSGRIFTRITQSPVRFLTTLLLGNTLAIVVFSIFISDLLENILHDHIHSQFEILAIQTIVSTTVILVVADFIPKIIFRSNANHILKLFSFPSMIVYYILLPFTTLILSIAYFLMKRIGRVNVFRYQSRFTKTDLHSYIQEHTTATSDTQEVEHEVQIFRNALSFPDAKVRDCMVAMVDAVAVDINDGLKKLKEKFEQTGLSRILVFGGNMDNVLGYVHYHEMFKNAADIKNILLPAPVIPESMPAKDALRIFMQQHKSMAIVVDEFGVNSGLLTTEDVIEKIFGEIHDEYDKEEFLEKQVAPNEYILSARLDIDDLNQKYNLNIPASGDYKTLGGFILHHTGSIPKTNETITINTFHIKVLSSSATRIEQVNLLVKSDG